MDVAVHYSTLTVGVLILGVSCPPVKWQHTLLYLEEVAGVLAIIGYARLAAGIYSTNRRCLIIHDVPLSC